MDCDNALRRPVLSCDNALPVTGNAVITPWVTSLDCDNALRLPVLSCDNALPVTGNAVTTPLGDQLGL